MIYLDNKVVNDCCNNQLTPLKKRAKNIDVIMITNVSLKICESGNQ